MQPRTMADFTSECRASGHNLNYRICPVCGSDEWKLYVDPGTGLWKCFAGQHNAGGKVDRPFDMEPATKTQDLLSLLSPTREKPEWDEIELPPYGPLTKIAQRYLKRRGLAENEIARLGIVEVEDQFRLLIPYFDRAGQMIYWTSRRYADNLGHGPKYLTAPGKHPLYVLRRRGTTPVVVEGVFDAIRVWQAGFTAIALGGKSLPRYLQSFLLTETADCGILVVMLDDDALKEAFQLRGRLSDRRMVRIVTPGPGKDPGSLSLDEIRRAIS